MTWSCVEDRVSDGPFGRVLRKIIFDDIYADRTALLSRHPIPVHTLSQLKAGDRIAFYDNTAIREGNFLCSGHNHNLSAKDILTHILQTEEEIKLFCEANHINTKNQHIFTLVIESFILLTKKIQFAQAPNYYSTDVTTHLTAGRSPVAGVKRPGTEPTWNVDNYLPRKSQSPSFHPSVLSELNRSLLAQAMRNNQLNPNSFRPSIIKSEQDVHQTTEESIVGQTSQTPPPRQNVNEDIDIVDTVETTPPVNIQNVSNTGDETVPSTSGLPGSAQSLTGSPSKRRKSSESIPRSPQNPIRSVTPIEHIANPNRDSPVEIKDENDLVRKQIQPTSVIARLPEHPLRSPPRNQLDITKEKKTKNSKSTPMKRKPLLMKTKLEILDEYKKGSKLSDIARRRGLNASTVHYIINQGRKKVEWNHMLMQKYNYISEMSSQNISPYEVPTLPSSSCSSDHSPSDGAKPLFEVSKLGFQNFGGVQSLPSVNRDENSPLSDLLMNNQMAHQLVQAVANIKETMNKSLIQ